MHILQYLPGGIPSLFGLSVIPAAQPGKLFVVLHDLPENPGVGVSDAVALAAQVVLNEFSEPLGPAAVEDLRWILKFFGAKEGVSGAFDEVRLEIGGDRWSGFAAKLADWLELDRSTSHHIRRELELRGEGMEAYGGFNID
ncbi:MAG: hypothetical protein KGZ83_14345 [Sulfuricella sp.]|nr:hypothetical protein [Sulfuricella sp.]